MVPSATTVYEWRGTGLGLTAISPSTSSSRTPGGSSPSSRNWRAVILIVLTRDIAAIIPSAGSSPHLMRRLRKVVVNRLLLHLIAGEGEEDHVVIDLRRQVHRAL